MCCKVRGRTKDECWRNYQGDKRIKGTEPLHVIPRSEKEAYQAMKNDNKSGFGRWISFSRI